MTAPRVNLSDDVIAKLTPGQRSEFGVKTREEIESDLDDRDEKKIQRMVESWLVQRGYWPRSPAYLDGRIPPKGFFIHVHSAKKNPIVLDLLILGNDGRFLELELKTRTGKVREAQEAILNSPNTCLARSAEDAVKLITEWENNP